MYFPSFSLENKLFGMYQTSFFACWGTWGFRAENSFWCILLPLRLKSTCSQHFEPHLNLHPSSRDLEDVGCCIPSLVLPAHHESIGLLEPCFGALPCASEITICRVAISWTWWTFRPPPKKIFSPPPPPNSPNLPQTPSRPPRPLSLLETPLLGFSIKKPTSPPPPAPRTPPSPFWAEKKNIRNVHQVKSPPTYTESPQRFKEGPSFVNKCLSISLKEKTSMEEPAKGVRRTRDEAGERTQIGPKCMLKRKCQCLLTKIRVASKEEQHQSLH